jgi:hypothetical protein
MYIVMLPAIPLAVRHNLNAELIIKSCLFYEFLNRSIYKDEYVYFFFTHY